MITKEQIDAWFADKEKLLVEAVSRLVSIGSVEGTLSDFSTSTCGENEKAFSVRATSCSGLSQNPLPSPPRA